MAAAGVGHYYGAISLNRISSRNASVISKPEALPITLSIPHSGHKAVCCARGRNFFFRYPFCQRFQP